MRILYFWGIGGRHDVRAARLGATGYAWGSTDRAHARLAARGGQVAARERTGAGDSLPHVAVHAHRGAPASWPGGAYATEHMHTPHL